MYEAVSRGKDHTHYAIKKLTKKGETPTSDEHIDEVEIMKQLDHPNIVKYYGSVTDRDH